MYRQPDFALPPEGDLAVVDADGTAVAVTVVDGTVHAIDDLCTHAQCSLSGGEVEDGAVVCPCHMGRFDLVTGKVLGGPPPAPVHVWRARMIDGVLELER